MNYTEEELDQLDKFAAEAMNGLLSKDNWDLERYETVARYSYKIAGEMIKKRREIRDWYDCHLNKGVEQQKDSPISNGLGL